MNDVDEFDVTPIVDNDPAADVVSENTAVGTAVGITAFSEDQDGTNNTVTYSLDNSAGGLFAIDSVSGVVTTAAAIDYETVGSTLNIVVRATSTDGSTVTQGYVITVNDVDEFDVTPITDTDATADVVSENTAVGTAVGITAFSEDQDGTNNTVTYSLDNSAGGLFAIDSVSGVVTTAAAIDYETVGSTLNIVVRATSTDGSTVTQGYVITVNDVDEFDVTPIVDNDPAADVVSENTAVGTAVGITAFSEDQDGTNNTVTYSLDNSAGGLFAIDSVSGVVTTAAAIDYETVGSTLNIVVRATSTDGSTVTQGYVITVNDVDEFDVTPIVDNDPAADVVSENTAVGTAVGITAFSEDQDGTNNTVTYSLDNSAGGLFAIDSVSGVVTTAAAIDYETVGSTLNIVVRATSTDGSTVTQGYVITVNDVDEFDVTPIVDTDATADVVSENTAVGTAVGITAFSEDQDGTNNTVTYSLDNSAGGLFAIDSVTGVVTTAAAIDYETVGSTLNIVVRAISTDGSTVTQGYVITVNDVDEFDVTPIVDNDPAADVVSENTAVGTAVGITAFSEDQDGTNNTVTYSLDNSAGGLFAIDSVSGVVTTAAAIDYETVGSTLNIVVRATSTDGSTVTQGYVITVNDVDEFDVTPIVDTDATADVVSENTAVGTAVGITAFSEDQDGTNNTVTYSLDNSAGGLFAIDSVSGVVTTAAAIDYETVGSTLNIVVRATSTDGSTVTQGYVITVNDVDEFDVTPIVDTDATADVVSENTAVGTAVGITAFSEDQDGTNNTVTYSLDNSAGGLFAIDSVSGVVTTAAAIDYETVGSTLNIVVRATSTDGSTVTQGYVITVNDVDEFDVTPIVDNDPAADVVSENTAVGTAVGITAFSEDQDGTNNTVTYSLDNSAGGLFAIDSVSGVVTTAAAIDYETVGSTLNIVVRATSTDGSTVTQGYVITVNDQNDSAPVISPSQLFSVSEHAVVGTSLGFVAVSDADTVGVPQNWTIIGGNSDGIFAVSSITGEITIADTTNLNFETTSSYTLTMTVSDGVNTSAPQTVSIAIIDQNDTPTFLPAGSLTIDENSTNGTVVGAVSAVDEDAGDLPDYSIVSGVPGQPFAINRFTGQITVADATQLDFETNTSFDITVRVTDLGGLVDTQVVTVSINDVNETPDDLTLSGGSVNENAAAGTVVGRVSGVDIDAGDSLVYSMTDNAGGRFAIDSSTGLITVAGTNLLDFEAADSHSITVRISDSGGLTYSESFTVTVNDVNEAPVAADDSVVGGQLDDLVVSAGFLTSNDVDVDGDSLTVVLVSGPSNGTLILSGDGSFTYTPAGSFSGADQFTYYVTDGSLVSNNAVVDIEIQVTLTTNPSTPDSTDSGSGESSGADSDSDSDSSTESDSGDSESEGEELTDNSDAVIRVNAKNQGPGSSEGDLLEGVGSKDISQQILRKTSSQLFIAVFLDEIPEADLLEESKRSSRAEEKRSDGSGGTSAGFLFNQLSTANPLFTGGHIDLDRQTFVYDQQEEMFSEMVFDKVVVGSTAAVSTSVSVGYVVWMLRGGSLLTTFLSSLPAWQAFDPLPVLESFEENDDDSEDKESLLSIVS